MNWLSYLFGDLERAFGCLAAGGLLLLSLQFVLGTLLHNWRPESSKRRRARLRIRRRDTERAIFPPEPAQAARLEEAA